MWLWLLGASALVLILPIWLVSSPAMPDYPAHLASFYLIEGGVRDPTLTRFYHIAWSFIPNLASELIVPWLAGTFGLVIAAKSFLSAAVAMWVLGPGLIQHALYGRIGLGALVAGIFAYNANFAWGFFNYYFAAGLAFLIFSAWIKFAPSSGQRSAVTLTLFAVAVTIVYFCHVFGATILLVMIAGYEIAGQRDSFRAILYSALRIGAIYAPAAFAFFFLKPKGAGEAAIQFNLADTWRDRYESLLLHHFDAPDHVLPIVFLAGLVIALALSRARIHPFLLPALIALLLGSLFAPEFAMGGTAVDLRLPAMFASLLLAAVEFELPAWLLGASATAMLGLCVWLAADFTADWRHYDKQFREFRNALAGIPRGTRLFTVLGQGAHGMTPDEIYWHMTEFAIIDRSAFSALLFATKGQHVVQLNAPFAPFAASTAQEGAPPDIGELKDLSTGNEKDDPRIRGEFPYLEHFQCHFDMAVVVEPGDPRAPMPDMLRLRHAGSFFDLADVRRDDRCGR